MEILKDNLQPGNQYYTLALPDNHASGPKCPLILALHFAGHGSPHFGKLMLTELVEPALRELGAILLAPDCTGPDWTHPKSEADVLALLDHIHENHNVDPSQTLIMGYSMGGIGTWFLGSRHQERFSGALVMAGLPPEGITNIEWEIPLYIIQSRHDQFMPLKPTEAALKELQFSGASVELVILDGITHFETWRYTEPLRDAIPWIKQTWGLRM